MESTEYKKALSLMDKFNSEYFKLLEDTEEHTRAQKATTLNKVMAREKFINDKITPKFNQALSDLKEAEGSKSASKVMLHGIHKSTLANINRGLKKDPMNTFFDKKTYKAYVKEASAPKTNHKYLSRKIVNGKPVYKYA